MNASISFFSLLLLLSLGALGCKVADYDSNAQPIEHTLFDELLDKHVSDEGWVDYEGFIRDSAQFKEYLALLSQHHPNDDNWSRNERLAYWINAYNAFTIKLIMDYYPVSSIKDIKSGIPFINTVWDIKFINIEDREYDLNNIEHGIIRPKFNEPRIHFAVNCASVSCPKLQNFAYTADRLDEQLDEAAREFLNDPSRNKISKDRLQLSKILDWYWGDFKDKYSSRLELVKKYTGAEIDKDAEVDFLDYNWGLNEQPTDAIGADD